MRMLTIHPQSILVAYKLKVKSVFCVFHYELVRGETVWIRTIKILSILSIKIGV